MHIVGVTGPADAGRPSLVERLLARLDEHGRVATVRDASRPLPEDETTTRYQHAGSTATYSRTDDGWHARGDQRTLDDRLEQLAPTYDFVVVDDFPDAAIPQVVLGDDDSAGETLASAPTATDIDTDAVVEELLARDPFETLSSLVATAKASPAAEKSGAIATFTGRVRGKEHDDDTPTEFLEFERYDEVATERMATIREELEAREGVFEVLLHHRTGVVEYGEDIVFVVVLAGHRQEAFATVEDGINRLKDEVPLFKKEVTVDDEFWAHE
ncbi:MAG: molybdopterin synthase [Haloarculaceae archaeon]